MSETITSILSYGTVFSHIVFVLLIVALIFSKSFGKDIINFIGKHAILFGFLISVAALVGSLLYSNVIGFEPCELCWWQRIFIYPQAVLFLVALFKKDNGVFKYSIPLSVMGAVVALYHTYIQLGGTTSVLPCTATGAACAKVFVLQFGYITIPTMSLTILAYLLLLALIKRSYDKNNSYA